MTDFETFQEALATKVNNSANRLAVSCFLWQLIAHIMLNKGRE
jgi:hypothetical protein